MVGPVIAIALFALVARGGGRLALRLNLAWTWALIPTAVGGLLVLATHSLLAVGMLGTGALAARALRRAERFDSLAGGELARAVAERLTVTGAVRRWFERRGLERRGAVRGDCFVLGAGPHGTVSLRFGFDSGRHGLCVGAAGSGKTNSQLWTVRCHLAAGFAAVFVDPKGSRATRAALQRSALEHGVRFRDWTLEGPTTWNPLADGNRSERTDKLLAVQQITEPHYEYVYRRYLTNLLRLLDERATPPTLADVGALLDPTELERAVRDCEDEALAGEVQRYLLTLGVEQRRQLYGLANRIMVLVEGTAGRWLIPTGRDPVLDLRSSLGHGELLYFGLDGSRYPDTARLVGNLIVQDLKAYCGAVEAGLAIRRPVVIAIDEFSVFDADHVGGLFARARSSSVSVVLATQELADLRRIAPGFEDQVLGNLEWLIAHRQNVPASAELLAEMGAGEERWLHTFAAADSGRWATRRRGRQLRFGADAFKELGVGRAIVIEKNPHIAQRVAVIEAEAGVG